jgi:hypothetical protein
MKFPLHYIFRRPTITHFHEAAGTSIVSICISGDGEAISSGSRKDGVENPVIVYDLCTGRGLDPVENEWSDGAPSPIIMMISLTNQTEKILPFREEPFLMHLKHPPGHGDSALLGATSGSNLKINNFRGKVWSRAIYLGGQVR